MDTESNIWIAYFDTDGFEGIFNVTEDAQSAMLDKLSGGSGESKIPLNQMMLRARFNGHRHPEIWTFNASAEIDEESLRMSADDNPQWLADWIRTHGTQIGGESPKTRQRQRIV